MMREAAARGKFTSLRQTIESAEIFQKWGGAGGNATVLLYVDPILKSSAERPTYLVLPMDHAFGKETKKIYASLRVLHGEWKYVVYSLGYVLALSAFCYSLALFSLMRKKHI